VVPNNKSEHSKSTLWAKSVGAVRLRTLPLSLVQQGCLRFGVSRCGPAAAVVGRGCWGVRCFVVELVGVNLSSSLAYSFVQLTDGLQMASSWLVFAPTTHTHTVILEVLRISHLARAPRYPTPVEHSFPLFAPRRRASDPQPQPQPQPVASSLRSSSTYVLYILYYIIILYIIIIYTMGPGPGLVARVLWLYCMRLASSGVGGVRRVRLANTR